MILGFQKLAEFQESEVAPEEQGHETLVTCLSDCQYAQNPEKVCMLKNISLQMIKPGVLGCGQYAPMEAPNDPVSGSRGLSI